jgi:hypothetical protein
MSEFKITNIKIKPLIHERKWYRENYIILLICSLTVLFGLWLSGGENTTVIVDEPQHPVVRGTGGLESFVLNNCDQETQKIWEKVAWYATYQGIKPEIIFAIAFADSGCGTNMTKGTSNNPGNVGNNDSGGRQSFANAFRGWIAIVDTLNNKNMRGIEKIGHLSQGGRNKMSVKYSCYGAPAPFMCYALSESNHNYNVINSLRSIYRDKTIDENWEFRIK